LRSEDLEYWLFDLLRYIFTGASESEKNQQVQRDLVSTIVSKNPSKYTTQVLGTPHKTYIQNIRNTNVWGSTVELDIFAQHYEAEITVITKECQEVVYGGGKGYGKRAFLLHTGDHFDVLTYSVSSVCLLSLSLSLSLSL
jgi:ubiquitin thioesterase OTU1